MSDANDPQIAEYEKAGRCDYLKRQPSKYTSLKAAENPYAEDYLRGWNGMEASIKEAAKRLLRNAA